MTTSHDPNGDRGPGLDRQPLRRCPHNKMIGGVAAGLAEYLGVDVTMVRIGFAVLTALGVLGIPLYLACWLLIPEEGVDRSLAEDLIDQFGLR